MPCVLCPAPCALRARSPRSVFQSSLRRELAALTGALTQLLRGCWPQADMLAKARAEFDSCIETVHNFDDFMAALDRKHMCLAPWCARGLDLG